MNDGQWNMFFSFEVRGILQKFSLFVKGAPTSILFGKLNSTISFIVHIVSKRQISIQREVWFWNRSLESLGAVFVPKQVLPKFATLFFGKRKDQGRAGLVVSIQKYVT